jgi:glycosyltransferase involved in cell wall biosynthesis
MIKKIIFDAERMKYPHTGLFHFCHHLGLALKENANPQQEQLSFFVRKEQHRNFGVDANYIAQHSLHKFLLPPTNKYDIWHSTYQASDYFPFNRKIKIVLTIHDLNFLHEENKTGQKIKKGLKQLQQKINRADSIVAISAFTKQDVCNHLNLNNKNVDVIYNGCNFKTIENIVKPQGKLPKDFLYTIGTITNKKNFHVLPALLVNNDKQLVISGIVQSENYYQCIIEEAKKFDVLDRLIFTGSISENDKQWYMSNCTAFVFPSLAEGFGLPVVEAMHFGKPIILSNKTSLPEIGGETAYYFENFDPFHMQQKLVESIDDFYKNNKDEQVIERANFFNWNIAAKQYLTIYNKL